MLRISSKKLLDNIYLSGLKLPWLVNSLRWYILGLETSCDDTGVALLDRNGTVVSEKVQSQTRFSVLFGGVLPAVAQQLHQDSIAHVTETVMKGSQITWKDLDGIAVTVKPGMPLSLKIGVSYAKQLAKEHALPIIPIHHMEAHALTTLLTDPELEFPFLVLLLSGGHGLLALARGLEDFILLGTALDASPGDVLDKIARRLKLHRLNDAQLNAVSGGRAIEILAMECTDSQSLTFDLPNPRHQKRDCDFSFTGIHIAAERLIDGLQQEYRDTIGTPSSSVLPRAVLADLCAAVQLAFTKTICRSVQRAIELTTVNSNLLGLDVLRPAKLVVSGGVAANAYIRQGLEQTTQPYGLSVVAPPPRLCTDNGVMIAWNGLLLFRTGTRIVWDPTQIDFEPRAPFGIDCRALVHKADLKIKPIKLKPFPAKASL